jgi:hypothetical protein
MTPANGPTNNPPSYLPNNYGYMSPSNKHMSVSTAPLTDAFGNPIPNTGMYGYPIHYQQGYQPPQMQQNPMASFSQPSSPPPGDNFGPVASPQLQNHETQPLVGSFAGTEPHSVRASSPSSVQANAGTAPASGGMEAFLQRHGRMSPQPDNDNQAPPPQGSSDVSAVGMGPHEMSAMGTMHRPQRENIIYA